MLNLLPPNAARRMALFQPLLMAKALDIYKNKKRFVHYTTAETGFNILKNRAVWMRNAITMNDFSEIEHGVECLIYAWKGSQSGQRFSAILEEHYPGLCKDLETRFDGWLPQFRANTFLTCLSEHLDTEDENGRLSMWRAYGGRSGVALVMKNTPFMATTDKLAAYSSPVAYLSKDEFAQAMGEIADNVARNADFLQGMGYEDVLGTMFSVFRFAVLCTKHPGFSEELEWRILYSPGYERSETITETIEVVRGIPQPVHQIPLKDAPDEGLHGADIPNLIDRVIIGPTADQIAIYQAFVSLLESSGVEDAPSRVKISGIPLRH